jgi:antitoxin PrlF
MATVTPAPPTRKQVAKVTSKGQITIPVEIRQALGVKPGDKLVFERTADGVKVFRQQKANPFEKMRGIGNFLPEGYHGRDGIIRYFRELRGHDAIDDLILGTEP